MTRLDRYRAKLAELEHKRNQYMRSYDFKRMRDLDYEIENVRKLIKEGEEYEAKPLSQLLSMDEIHESGILPLIMECHLAADYLNDCSCELENRIRKLGFNPVSVIPDIKDIIKKTSVFASALMLKNPRLAEMLLDNETLIKTLHSKTWKYIAQRSEIKDKKQCKAE